MMGRQDLSDSAATPLVRVTQLDNGLRVVTQNMPSLRSVALGVWVGVGARHETLTEHGLSHLLEHMAFKGTQRRSARQIAEEIEQVGGDMNAATSLEQTAYYVRVLADDVPLAVDVLADITQHSAFDPNELVREKDVILQEIASLQDSPDEIAYDQVQLAAFPDHSIGRPIIGTPQSVVAIGPDMLRDYLRRHYTAERTVVAAAGLIDHDTFVDLVANAFTELPAHVDEAVTAPKFVGGPGSSDEPFEQAHVVVGFPAPAFQAPDFIACQVLSALLGGGMSSRLFQEVREELGLCYSIYSSAWGLSDAGFFTIHAATGHDLVMDLSKVLAREIDKLASEAVSPRELDRARSQLTAGLMLSLESPPARAGQLARQLLVHGRLIGLDELAERIGRVTAEDVRAFAERLVSVSPPAVAVVGPGKAAAGLAAQVVDVFSERAGSA